MQHITVTRAMAVGGQHKDPGEVLAVGIEIAENDARYLVNTGSALEGDFADLYAPGSAIEAASATAGKAGDTPPADDGGTGGDAGDETGDES